jgi:hypothetical protein
MGQIAPGSTHPRPQAQPRAASGAKRGPGDEDGIDQSGSFFKPVWPEPLNDDSGYEIGSFLPKRKETGNEVAFSFGPRKQNIIFTPNKKLDHQLSFWYSKSRYTLAKIALYNINNATYIWA